MSSGAERIVVLGMMTKMPVAGVVWQTVHYLVGLERLGYEVWYVEAHARTPSMLMEHEADDSGALAAAFIDRVMRRFDLAGRWAYHALHSDGRFYGLSEAELKRLYRSAALIVNLHGGTKPLPEHYESGRLVYVETDPVQLQIELHDNVQETLDFLAPHVAFFTFGENYGKPDCLLPVASQFEFHTTRQPVVIDFWADHALPPGGVFTTIGNWRQDWRPVTFAGETYSWSKHREFSKFVELPRLTGRRFELALSSYGDEDRAILEEHGWEVRPGLGVSRELDDYRDYIASSRAEFTVAKDQNVRLRSGWFSDRSATYLAAGRPVVTQDTGFGTALPTGEGLLAFSDLEQAAEAIEDVEHAYGRHADAASSIARSCFSSDVVLGALLHQVGLGPPTTRGVAGGPEPGPLSWPVSWEVATDASDPEYDELVEHIRKVASKCLPEEAAVAVVSRGDDELLRLDGRRTWHFPQADGGEFAGHYPADSAEAIAHLASLRRAGASHLLFPATALWWLDHYTAFRGHLEEWDKQPLQLDDCCVMFRLKEL